MVARKIECGAMEMRSTMLSDVQEFGADTSSSPRSAASGQRKGE
jgi:hypothetical protein